MEDKSGSVHEVNEEFDTNGHYVDEGEGPQDDEEIQAIDVLRDNNHSDRNNDELKKANPRYTDMMIGKASNSTPETKLNSAEFSTGRQGRGNSLQIDFKRKRMSERQDNDGNETFITSTDYHQQMSTMDDRLTKLENLIWSLYRELNGKIENSFANCTIEANEIAQQVTQQLGNEIEELRTTITHIQNTTNFVSHKQSEDEGYEGSEENIEEEAQDNFENFDEEQYIQGPLDKVVEEASREYDSNPEKSHEMHKYAASGKYRHTKQRSNDSNSPERRDNFRRANYTKEEYDDKLTNSDQEKQSTPQPEIEDEGEAEGEGEENNLEYYFSCHERMINDYSNKSAENAFDNINKDELKENITMPDLSRSTLVDQIDYDLDNYKINESSVFESSVEDAYASNRNINCSTLRENKQI